MGSWHFQRIGLTGPGFGAGTSTGAAGVGARLVFYDQRSHGKSGRAPDGHSTMEHLAADLRAVVDTAAPSGPVALIGHSMGGMAILSLAAADPDLFAQRVVGVGLVSTGATYLSETPLNRLIVTRGNPVVRAVTGVAGLFPAVFERGRASSNDAKWLITRSLGFSRKDVSGHLVDYLDEMISATPVEVIADYAPSLWAYDRSAAVPALAGIPTVIVAGDRDRMTPLARSQAIADVLPEAEFVISSGTGHLTLMEDPELTNDALRRMLERSVVYGRRQAARRRRTARR
jgi:pimeloyl-ACP methyl ester carboxylesterase